MLIEVVAFLIGAYYLLEIDATVNFCGRDICVSRFMYKDARTCVIRDEDINCMVAYAPQKLRNMFSSEPLDVYAFAVGNQIFMLESTMDMTVYEIVLKHEYCHVTEYRNGRNLSSEEEEKKCDRVMLEP